MKLLKKELEALREMAEAPNAFATPEEFCQGFADKLDELRGERLWWFGCFIYAGCPGVIGPYSTRLQAKKALDRQGYDKGWTVLGWTHEGQILNLEKVNAKVDRDVDDTPAKDFWRKAFAIKDGEEQGFIASNIKVLKV